MPLLSPIASCPSSTHRTTHVVCEFGYRVINKISDAFDVHHHLGHMEGIRGKRTISSFCWIIGISDDAFSVSIEDDKKVEVLKEVIFQKKQGRLKDVVVGSEALTLWEVCRFSLL